MRWPAFDLTSMLRLAIAREKIRRMIGAPREERQSDKPLLEAELSERDQEAAIEREARRRRENEAR